MGLNVQRLSVEYYFTATDGNDEGLKRFMQNAAMTGCRNARNAQVIAIVRDEHGTELRRELINEPSEHMQRFVSESTTRSEAA